MRRYIAGLVLLCLALLQPSRSLGQHPLDEGQQKLIGMSSQQQKQLEEVFSKAGPKRQAIRARLHDLYTELLQLDENYTFDEKRSSFLRNQIVEQQRQLLALHATNEAKIRGILTAEQFLKLRALMKEERARHDHGPHGPDWKGWGGDHSGHPPGDHPEPPVGSNVSQRRPDH